MRNFNLFLNSFNAMMKRFAAVLETAWMKAFIAKIGDGGTTSNPVNDVPPPPPPDGN